MNSLRCEPYFFYNLTKKITSRQDCLDARLKELIKSLNSHLEYSGLHKNVYIRRAL